MEQFGNLTVSRGKTHNFLGMDIELLADGELYFFMKYYIKESIYLFGEEISTAVSFPANKGLHKISESSTRL